MLSLLIERGKEASLGRFERPTLCSASKCSDPLSYRDVRANDFTTNFYLIKERILHSILEMLFINAEARW